MFLPMQYLNPTVLRCSYFNGYSTGRPVTLTERTVHDYELEYYLRSDGGVVVDGTYVSFQTGDLNFRKPGQVVCGVPPYECYILCVDFLGNAARSGSYVFGSAEEAQARYDNPLLSGVPDRLTVGKNEVIPNLLRDLLRSGEEAGDLAEFRRKATVYYLFQEVFIQAQSRRQAGWTGVVKHAVREIRERFAQIEGVESLVHESGLSKSYFHARFLEETGVTPGQMLTRCRIDQAKNLLMMTQMEVADVGLQCGYGDAAYFSRVFRKQTGMTPGGFRRRVTTLSRDGK